MTAGPDLNSYSPVPTNQKPKGTGVWKLDLEFNSFPGRPNHLLPVEISFGRPLETNLNQSWHRLASFVLIFGAKTLDHEPVVTGLVSKSRPYETDSPGLDIEFSFLYHSSRNGKQTSGSNGMRIHRRSGTGFLLAARERC